MDVTGWTIDQRMRLPDWCFGNRRVISVSITTYGPTDWSWKISGVTLPANICIWQIGLFPRTIDSYRSYCRAGFRATLPTSTAEMDTAIPVLPDFGNVAYTPPRIYLPGGGHEVWQFIPRKGMATGGNKLTVELYCFNTEVAIVFFVVYSELPTDMAGWLAHNVV